MHVLQMIQEQLFIYFEYTLNSHFRLISTGLVRGYNNLCGMQDSKQLPLHHTSHAVPSGWQWQLAV